MVDIVNITGNADQLRETVSTVAHSFDQMSDKANTFAAEFATIWHANTAQIADYNAAMAGIPAKDRNLLIRLLNQQRRHNEEQERLREKAVQDAVNEAGRMLNARNRMHQQMEAADERANAKAAARMLRNRTSQRLGGEARTLTDTMAGSYGGVPTNATPQALSNIATARRQVEQLVITGKVAADRMEELFLQIRRGALSLTLLTNEERQAEVALRRLTNAFDSATTAGKRSQELFISWRSALRIFAVQQLHYGISAVSNQFTEASKTGAEFQVKIAEIQTISQKSGQTTGQWARELRDLSNSFDLELLGTAAAGYEAISNQIVKGSNAAGFLNTAFEFSRTTSSNAMQGVNLLSSSINGFNLASFEADKIAAQFFKTIELGRVRTEQISNIFGNTAPMAHALGVSMEELNAGLATLTIQGVRPDTSLTLLNNVILKLIKPGEDMKEMFKDWGVASGEAAVAAYGFEGVLKRLEAEFQKGGLTRVGELAQDMRAIRGQIGLMGGGAFDNFKKNLAEITKGEEEYTKATEIMAENAGTALKRIQREMVNLLTVESGMRFGNLLVEADRDIGGLTDKLQPLIGGLVNTSHLVLDITKNFAGLGAGMNYLIPVGLALAGSYRLQNNLLLLYNANIKASALEFGKLNVTTKASITGFQQLGLQFGLLKANVAGNLVATQLLTTAMATLQAVALPLAIGGLTYLVVQSYEADRALSQLADTIASNLNKAMEQSNKDLRKTLSDQQTTTDTHVKEMINKYNQYVAGINLIFKSFSPDFNEDEFERLNARFKKNLPEAMIPALEQIKNKMNEVFTLGNKALASGDIDIAKKAFDQVNDYAQSINDRIKSALSSVRKELESITSDREEAVLDRLLLGKSGKQKTNLLKKELEKVLKSATQSEAGGDMEGAVKKLEQAETIVKRMESAAGKKSKDKSIFDTQIKVYDAQLALQKRIQEELEKRKINEDELAKTTVSRLASETKDAKEYAESLQQVKNQLDGVKDKLRDLREEYKNIVEEKGKTQGDLAGNFGVLSQLIGYGGKFQLAGNLQSNASNFRPALNAAGLNFKKVAEQATEMAKLQREMSDATKANDQEAFNNALNRTVQLYTQLKPALDVINKALPKATYGENDSLKLLFDSTESLINKSKEIGDRPQKLQQEIQTYLGMELQMAAKLDEANARMAQTLAKFPSILNQVQGAMGANVETINQQLERLQKNLDSMKNFQGRQLDGLGVGGGFAQGGRIGGRDNMLVRANSGERIMSQQAEASFGPTLASMNSNGKSSSTGGTLINVGGVNVPVTNSNGGNIDYVKLGRNVQRAVQRGLVKLS